MAVCMATFNPPPELLRRQLDSIRAQTHRNWVCVISDDCSSPESFAALEEAVADDPRFVVSRSPERLHFYRNFERALGLAPAGADFVAMADQDDAWHPDKLETLLAEIGGAQLVYSDARIIDREGELISDTYWSIRRPNHENLLSLLMANSVTGAASLFRRDLLDLRAALPAAPVLPLPRSLDRSGGAGAGHRGLRRASAVRLRAARQRGPGPRRSELDAAVARLGSTG